jgi:hypothetical protein
MRGYGLLLIYLALMLHQSEQTAILPHSPELPDEPVGDTAPIRFPMTYQSGATASVSFNGGSNGILLRQEEQPVHPAPFLWGWQPA